MIRRVVGYIVGALIVLFVALDEIDIWWKRVSYRYWRRDRRRDSRG